MALLVVTVGASAVLAWRLSQGPIEIPWIRAQIVSAFNQQSEHLRLEIRSSALAWEGFHRGQGSPIDIRLGRVALVDASGAPQIAIPDAEITLSLLGLLTGRIEPEEITIEQPNIVGERLPDGQISLVAAAGRSVSVRGPVVDPVAILGELAQPPVTGTSRGGSGDLSRVRRVQIEGATLRLVDRRLGVTWLVPQAGLDLVRARQGGLQGQIGVSLVVGDQRAEATGSISLPPAGAEISLQLQLSPVLPSAWAKLMAVLAPLAALDLPMGGEVTVTLGLHQNVRQMRLAMQAGSGIVHIGQGTVPIERATFVATATPERIVVDSGRVTLPGSPGTLPSTLELSGTVHRLSGRLEAALILGIDRLSVAELPQLWPAGLGGDARRWVVQNITSGNAYDGHFEVRATADANLSNLAVTGASGSIAGDGLTVYWLRPVPPIIQAQAVLHLIDPDTLEITSQSALSAPETPGGESLAVRSFRMRITGMIHSEQAAEIKTKLAGSIPAAIALLRDPRLSLLPRHPMPLNDPAGQVAASVTVSLPLDARVTMSQIAIAVQAHLTSVHLGDVVAGNDLDQGTLDLSAGNNGLSLDGTALLASVPVQLQASMDFRAGPANGVVQRIGITAQPDARELAVIGLDAGGLVAGPVPLTAELAQRRSGAGTVDVKADLTPATLTIDALGWHKPAGRPATATATLVLGHDRLTGIDPIRVNGDSIELRGAAEFVEGRLARLHADQVRLDRTTARALVNFPSGRGPISANISGEVLDLSGRFPPSGPAAGRKSPAPSPPGPPWTADARFDRVILAGDNALTNLAVRATDDGRELTDLRLSGLTQKQAPVLVTIRSDGPRRTLTGSAADAGALLRALGATDSMVGGRMAISAAYDDTAAGDPLAGTAEVDDFSVRNAPVVGKLLQAVTLYGLVEALRGPGLQFRKLVMPFSWREGVLTLDDARAFSPSLGLTAKGYFDLNAQRVDLQGTIVPAYFFNSLLGRVPVLGRLFSPERGGGVIAGSYSLRGPINNPKVVVDPLTALTPGFLRGLFKLF